MSGCKDAEFLVRNEALPADRVLGVETGGCPHTAIRADTKTKRKPHPPFSAATGAQRGNASLTLM